MHKNMVRRCFLALVFASALWYTGMAWYAYYHYSHLNASTKASAVSWEVEEKSEDHHVLKATYQYEVKGHSYSGTFTFQEEPYRNRWSAEQSIKESPARELNVWFDSEDPSYSSLEKSFPFKEYVSTIFLWGLFLYFLWLGFYVSRFRN